MRGGRGEFLRRTVKVSFELRGWDVSRHLIGRSEKAGVCIWGKNISGMGTAVQRLCGDSVPRVAHLTSGDEQGGGNGKSRRMKSRRLAQRRNGG